MLCQGNLEGIIISSDGEHGNDDIHIDKEVWVDDDYYDDSIAIRNGIIITSGH